jgi:hypothetical protein
MSASTSNALVEVPGRGSKMRAALAFIAHQLMATFGSAIAAAIGVNFFFAVLRPVNPQLFASHNASRILTELPYFPAQIASSLWWGWYLSRRFRHRSMLWVWVLPFAVLSCAVLALPTMFPSSSPVPLMLRAGVGQSRWSHYFGRGCTVRYYFCSDQLFITMPFYASVAYSVAALLGRRSARIYPWKSS